MNRVVGWIGIALLWLPVAAGFGFEGSAGLAMLSARQLGLLANSVVYACLVGVVCSFVGFLIAFCVNHLSPKQRRIVLILLVGTAALPSIVISTPSLILLLRLMPNHSQGLLPALIVQAFAFTPISALIAVLSVSALPRDQVNAAMLLPSPSKALFRAVLPMLRPGMAAAFGLASLLSVIDFTITSIFNWNTYSLEAFTDISAGQPVMGASLPLLMLGLIGSIVCGRWMSRLVWTESSLGFQVLPLPIWVQRISIAATVVFSVTAAGMFLGLLSSVESLHAASTSLTNASGDALSSLKINLATCAISLIWALAIAPLLLRSRSWVPWALTLAPFSFLPTLVGIVFAQLGVRLGIFGVWLPALALSVRIVPIASVLIAIWFGQIDRSAIESARVSLSVAVRTVRVYLPIALPALAMAACLSFISGLGDVGTMLLVVQPGQSTLSLRLYNYLHYGSAPDSTVISFIIMCFAMSLALVFTARRQAA